MSTLGILLFTSPIQHRGSEVAAGLAESAAELGHRVRIFCLGDGVLNTSQRMAEQGPDSVVYRLARLPSSVSLVNCTTCARFRGLGDEALIPNARNGTLEDLVELLGSSDRFLTLSGEV